MRSLATVRSDVAGSPCRARAAPHPVMQRPGPHEASRTAVFDVVRNRRQRFNVRILRGRYQQGMAARLLYAFAIGVPQVRRAVLALSGENRLMFPVPRICHRQAAGQAFSDLPPKRLFMSRIVKFRRTGGPEVLEIVNESVAAPGPGEIQIQVHAIGINRAEVMFRQGAYLEAPELPARLGYEAAGTVAAIGPGVTGFTLGDAVSSIPAFSQNQYGVYGELANVPAFAVAKNPASLSWVEAAAVWMPYMTAYGALVEFAGTQAGEFVLIPAASSSVGVAAIEVANLIGAVPIAVTRTEAKRAALLAAGAQHVIVTDGQDLVAEVQRITEGKGARVVFDPVGGPALARLAEATAQGGIIFEYGALSTEATPFPLFAVLSKQLTIRGYTLFEISSNEKRLDRAKKFIFEGLANGKLTPTVAKVFKLNEIVEAHRYMESNVQIGKIVVTP